MILADKIIDERKKNGWSQEELAEMLSVSYSQFRTLEKEGAFPFRRRMIGGKTVRYLNKDIIDYMLVGSLANDPMKEENNE